jgi:hypothetical protein
MASINSGHSPARGVLCSHLAAGLFFTERDIENPARWGPGGVQTFGYEGGSGGVAEGRHNHIVAPMLQRNKASKKYNAPASKIVSGLNSAFFALRVGEALEETILLSPISWGRYRLVALTPAWDLFDHARELFVEANGGP